MRTRAHRLRRYLPTVTVHPTASASIRPAGARMSVPNYAIGEFYLMECRNLNSAVARLDRQGPEGRQSQACQGVRPTRHRQPSTCTGTSSATEQITDLVGFACSLGVSTSALNVASPWFGARGAEPVQCLRPLHSVARSPNTT